MHVWWWWWLAACAAWTDRCPEACAAVEACKPYVLSTCAEECPANAACREFVTLAESDCEDLTDSDLFATECPVLAPHPPRGDTGGTGAR